MLFKYIKKYWYFAILAPLFMAGEVCMDLLQPEFMAKIIDEGVNVNPPNLNVIINNGLIMIALVLIGGICGILSAIFANLCSQNVSNDLRIDCFKRIMHFSFEQTEDFSTGSLITRITNDITQIQNFVGMLIRGFVRTFMLFTGGIVCMLLLDLNFGIVLACSLPLVMLFVFGFIKIASPKFKEQQKKIDRLNQIMQENVGATRVVKAYVKEDYEIKRFGKANDELVKTQTFVLKLFSFMSPITNIILNVSIVAIIYVGSINISLENGLTTGNIMASITYISRILMAVLNMANFFQVASRALASLTRVSEVLKTLPVINDGDYESLSGFGKIDFKNVSFAYPDQPDTYILKDLNFTIAGGETVGILGATGSGKSSLISLIPRFYDVSSGQILIDDVDVKEYKLKCLRKKVAVALQKSELFSKTIYENISLSEDSSSQEEVINAAKIACADDFISAFPYGYYTMVAEKGMSLSGGQRQRIAIARTILKKAPIVIFDDATSALDLQTEAQLYANLKKQNANATTIIIAQRISSIRNANRIIVLDEGKIADIGSHDELLKRSTIYQEIYNSQLKGVEYANESSTV